MGKKLTLLVLKTFLNIPSRLISKKVVPVQLDASFSSCDHFYFEKVHLISTYENNTRNNLSI